MNYSDIIGSFGVGLILVVYFANIFSLIPENGKLFYTGNIIGSALACYASFLILYWPFVIMEGIWALASVAGLIKTFRKQR